MCTIMSIGMSVSSYVDEVDEIVKQFLETRDVGYKDLDVDEKVNKLYDKFLRAIETNKSGVKLGCIFNQIKDQVEKVDFDRYPKEALEVYSTLLAASTQMMLIYKIGTQKYKKYGNLGDRIISGLSRKIHKIQDEKLRNSLQSKFESRLKENGVNLETYRAISFSKLSKIKAASQSQSRNHN